MTIQSVLPILTDGGEYLVTSPFGYRKDPFTGEGTYTHKGVDLVLWKGYGALSDIGAAFAGTVAVVSFDNSRGNFVMIDHGNGYMSHYYHMADKSVKVSRGDYVEAGQVLGSMGSTGYSTGAHLHFQLEKDGVAIDPLPFITGEDMMPGTAAKDEAPEDWSREAVEWALSNGILYGDGTGNLMLKEPCTREQMVVFLHRLYRLITEGTAG